MQGGKRGEFSVELFWGALHGHFSTDWAEVFMVTSENLSEVLDQHWINITLG